MTGLWSDLHLSSHLIIDLTEDIPDLILERTAGLALPTLWRHEHPPR